MKQSLVRETTALPHHVDIGIWEGYNHTAQVSRILFFPLLDFYRLKLCIFYFQNYKCCFEIFQKTLAIRFWRPKMEPCHAQRGCLGCSVRCNVLVNMTSRMEQWAQMELLSRANLPALNHWENTLHQIQFPDVHNFVDQE